MKPQKIALTNAQGKVLKTIFSHNIMIQIADIMEDELKKNNIDCSRNGTSFSVNVNDFGYVVQAQLMATQKLYEKGIITREMIGADIDANFAYY